MTIRSSRKRPFDPRPRWLRWEAQPWGDLLAEQLHYIERELLSGDPLSTLRLTHDGSPDRVDANGDTKSAYRSLVADVNAFTPIAELLSSPQGKLGWLISTRCSLRKNGKVRNIDIPAEKRRLVQHARMLLTLIPRVFKKRALDPRVIGFRSLREFEKFARRRDGYTIQDGFADSMQLLIREHGPFILLIDLVDAFANLPHTAIKTALKELLGLDGKQAREVVELARIQTRLGDGRLHKPKDYGVEQGSPIAPLLFNLVQTLIARRLSKEGFESGCFGDDIGIAAKSKAEAERAFRVYKQILIDLGFDVDVALRDLGDDPNNKASFIYDTRKRPVPLIKTYLVTAHEISLTPDKALELISHLRIDASTKEARRRNKWKAVSWSYLRRLLRETRPIASAGSLSRPRQTPRLQAEGVKVEADSPRATCSQILIVPRGVDPDPSGDGELQGEPVVLIPPQKGTKTMGTRSTAMPSGTGSSSCTQGADVEGPDPLCSYPDSALAESTRTEYQLGAGKTAQDQLLAGRPHDGRVSTPRGGPEAGFLASDIKVETDRHHVSTLAPVFSFIPVRDEHVELLAGGRRLRAGESYKSCNKPRLKTTEEVQERVVLDIRQVGDRIPAWRREWATKQLVRVASERGRTDLIVHPGDVWFAHLRDLDGNGFRVGVREDVQGVIVTVRERMADVDRQPRTVERPPDAEVVIDRISRSRKDRRTWRVKARTAQGVRHVTFSSKSFDHTIGMIEVVALALAAWQPKTVAFPSFGQVHRLLSDKVRLRQADLHRAVESMSGMRFKKASANWMLAERA